MSMRYLETLPTRLILYPQSLQNFNIFYELAFFTTFIYRHMNHLHNYVQSSTTTYAYNDQTS